MTEIVFYDLAAEHDLFRAELDEAYRRVTVHTPGPLQRYYDAGGVAV